MVKSKVFLGGTCNGDVWRDYLITMIQVDYFNPVVEDWTEECQKIEKYEKDQKCDVHLYVITNKMKGVFSIAEVMDSLHTHGRKVIFHVIPDGFDKFQLKSLEAVVDLVKKGGGIAYIDSELGRTERVINYCFKTTDFN